MDDPPRREPNGDQARREQDEGRHPVGRRIAGADAVQHAFHDPTADPRSAQADRQTRHDRPHRLAQDVARHLTGAGADGEADAHLATPQPDDERGDRVEPGRGQDQRERAEARREDREPARAGALARDAIRGQHRRHPDVRLQALQRGHERAGDHARVGGSHRQVRERVAQDRHAHGRREVVAEFRQSRVAHDADDAEAGEA
ncbi:MAG: hypothetical protein R2752_00745 [Vicinamibacterales bacterium]